MNPISNAQDQIITVGLDIGSSTIICAIGQISMSTKQVKLLGISSVSSSGIRRGTITNRDELIEKLELVLSEAEHMANVKVTKAILSITGDHIRSLNTQAAIALNRTNGSLSGIDERSITENDIYQVLDLAQAIALQTPNQDDGVKEMLGLTVAGPGAPQPGASGVHVFDSHGDVGGSGYDVCTFGLDSDGAATLTCHSTWARASGLDDQGIPKAVLGCMDSTATNFDADATKDDGSCTFAAVIGCMDSTANNYNADATSDDGSCTFDTVEPEPEPEPEPEEEEDEVPGFGLLGAFAAIGVALILRRRL